MTIRVRPYRRGGWEVDIVMRHPDGTTLRERRKAPVSSKSGAQRWAAEREKVLLLEMLRPPAKPEKEVPTLEAFKPRFFEGHCRANKQKPSSIESKESVYRNYLIPLLGKKRLDEIGAEDVARLKSHMAEKEPSTTNNVLSTLSITLKVAAEWGVIEHVPVRVRLLKRTLPPPRFYDFDQYQWLIDAATAIDPRILVVVLLGGDAGLRRGEIIALELTDCDLRRGLLSVERSEWKGKVTETKGMECRSVPMTARLRAAIGAIRHLRGPRLLYTDEGQTVTAKSLLRWMTRVQRRAQLRNTGNLHVLRHTFCSHLAMAGAPALSIQKLAGHKHLQTTLRYMHLAPGETDRAIRMLERTHAEGRERLGQLGDILETAAAAPAVHAKGGA